LLYTNDIFIYIWDLLTIDKINVWNFFYQKSNLHIFTHTHTHNTYNKGIYLNIQYIY